MAQLNSRGTMVRNRWDFFERTNGFAFIYGSVPSGPVGAYFANNSQGALQLDIFNLTWAASVVTVVEVAFLLPPLVLVPVGVTESFIHPLQPDSATPAGAVGMFSTFSSVYWTIQRYSNGANYDEISPIPTSYWLTLPPQWAVAAWSNDQPATNEFSMTIWYQEVRDNISPAI
jgi:hypothetical protein